MQPQDVARVIGNLETSVKNLTETWQRQDSAAAVSREALRDRVECLSRQVDKQTGKLAEIEPAIKRFEADRQRREGANSMLKVIWAGVIVFATGLGYVGHEVAQIIWPRPH